MYWMITSSLIALFSLFVQTGWSAPPSYGYSPPAARQGGGEELTTVLRLLRIGLSDLQHEVRNQES